MRRILISGASVAGPALAHWLHRYGFEVTVVERAPAPRGGGYAVDFRGASLEVLRRMGVLDELRAVETGMGETRYVDAAGRRIASMPAVAFSGELEVLRGDLVEVLHRRTAGVVEHLFGDSVTGLTEDADGVRVTFENAAPRTFDLVVGADGLHSNVRGLVFGPEREHVHELGFYASVFTTANHLGLDRTGVFHNSPGRIAGLYSARHNTEAKAVFYFAADPLTYDRGDVARQRELVAEAFAGQGWEVPRLLAAMADAPDFYFDSVSQVRMASSTRGRVALVGDAGYCASPLSGMGTSLALVGAYVLEGELAAAGGDHRVAFPEYERRLRDFALRCRRQAVDSARWFVPRTRAGLWLRDLNYRMMTVLPTGGLVARMALKVANAITLEDYRGAAVVQP
ncbi:FAD-dependent monooxygenase [Umezawaea tangerina]|uniref:2-polyprenyl-6-methoxyphenol hydroxylase-like FAD-dependent oxidoreductase n=1 Tax=Umezawaea tangerina TaxID=84725 RepID=A0A2T0SRU0_9PSEU|nr:FAD-dependent monooxygenase [Umezawaea tangerina]PRY36093.1 2-polyprenyl-6-methoxyphenol hydroxylase-like FAD-dependent oxidoreductase [Umezawaea tangerina]